MGLFSKYLLVTVDEIETHCYDNEVEATQHDKFMIASGWRRRSKDECDGKIYQIFDRTTTTKNEQLKS